MVGVGGSYSIGEVVFVALRQASQQDAVFVKFV